MKGFWMNPLAPPARSLPADVRDDAEEDHRGGDAIRAMKAPTRRVRTLEGEKGMSFVRVGRRLSDRGPARREPHEAESTVFD